MPNVTFHDWRELLDFAKDVSINAGNITLRYFGSLRDVEWKPDDTPVTVADRESETYIRARIQSKYPNHAILGEEFKEKETDSDKQRPKNIRGK